MSEIKKGDRVKVTIEGDLYRQDDRTVEVRAGKSFVSIHNWDEDPSAVTIEKIEPPVEVFGRGDLVRYKKIPEYTYLITDDGYVEMHEPIRGYHRPGGSFTSRDYEKVDLS